MDPLLFPSLPLFFFSFAADTKYMIFSKSPVKTSSIDRELNRKVHSSYSIPKWMYIYSLLLYHKKTTREKRSYGIKILILLLLVLMMSKFSCYAASYHVTIRYQLRNPYSFWGLFHISHIFRIWREFEKGERQKEEKNVEYYCPFLLLHLCISCATARKGVYENNYYCTDKLCISIISS